MDEFLDEFSLSEKCKPPYEREISLNNIQGDFIKLLNESNFEGDDVVKNIILRFTDDMNVSAVVYTRRGLNYDEAEQIRSNISEVFKINVKNIDISM